MESKTVRIKALQDRPSLNIKANEVLQMELEGDLLIHLYHEQALGLVEVEEVNNGK